MPYSEAQLSNAVNAVFQQFDKDNSGSLDQGEVTALINAALDKMGAGRKVTEAEVKGLITKVDKNSDGKIGKDELL